VEDKKNEDNRISKGFLRILLTGMLPQGNNPSNFRSQTPAEDRIVLGYRR